MTYRDYLIYTAAGASKALNDAVVLSLSMETDEELAVEVLETALRNQKYLIRFDNPNPVRVEPRPEFGQMSL